MVQPMKFRPSVSHRRGLLLLVSLVVSVGLLPAPASPQPQPTHPYELGLRLKKSGDWQKALQVWLDGRAALDREGRSDPRIGFGFIELATERGATDYYPAASELYFWGLERYDMARFEQVIREELERMAAILDRRQRTEWNKLLSAHDPALNDTIITFWARQDPAPSTPQNERLLEHWLRIAYARKNFRQGKSTVYGTDDRGLVYVRFGEPERIGRGRLGTNRFVFRRWTDVIGQYQGASRAERERMVRELERHNNTPAYEIWVYTTFDPQNPIFYLFGRENGTGSYGLLRGVEDLISDRAFLRTSTRYTGGLLPGAVLQTVYYEELVHYHDFFVDRLRDLEEAWVGFEQSGTRGLSTSTFRTLRQHFQLLDKERVERTDEFSPANRSTFERSVAPVDLTLQAVRLLDEANRPVVAFVAISSPRLEEITTQTRAEYRLVHNLILRDEKGRMLQRLVDKNAAEHQNIGIFRFPHSRNQKTFQFIAEVFAKGEIDLKETPGLQAAGPSPLIGFQQYSVEADTLLSTAPDRLELSDLVIGIEPRDASLADRVPFPVLPGNTILYPPRNLKVYLEAYHLTPDTSGVAHFILDLQVARLKGRKRERQEMISLRFPLETTGTRSRETFDVDISSLPVGEFELQVEVTDTTSGESRRRTATFGILKEEDSSD